MIVKMKKYTFLVYHKQYLDFLEKVKDIGVLHVIEKPEGITENDALRDKMQLAARVKHVLKQLERLRPKDAVLPPADPHHNGLDVLARVEDVLHEQEHLQQQLALTSKERDRMEVWGRFSHKRIAELEQAGILLTFFSCPTRKFDPEWETAYHAFEIDQIGSTLYFVTVTRPGETVDIDADRIVDEEDREEGHGDGKPCGDGRSPCPSAGFLHLCRDIRRLCPARHREHDSPGLAEPSSEEHRS